jgi:hypothetical protein
VQLELLGADVQDEQRIEPGVGVDAQTVARAVGDVGLEIDVQAVTEAFAVLPGEGLDLREQRRIDVEVEAFEAPLASKAFTSASGSPAWSASASVSQMLRDAAISWSVIRIPSVGPMSRSGAPATARSTRIRTALSGVAGACVEPGSGAMAPCQRRVLPS